MAAAALAIYRAPEHDLWFHLAAGRWIAHHGLPATEPWCLAALGQRPWLPEWLFQLALYGIHAIAGDWGLGLWRALWAAVALALSLAIARDLGASPWAALLIAPLALAVTRERQTARPEQVSLALLLLYVAVFERARRTGRDHSPWLLLAQILWANVQQMWVMGPAVAALYAVGAWLERGANEGGRRPLGRPLRWGLLAIALVAASAIAPRPLDNLTLWTVRNLQADPTRGVIGELRRWSWTLDRGAAFTAFVLLAAAAAMVGARRLARAPALSLAALGAIAAGLAIFRMRGFAVMTALPAVAMAMTRVGPRARASGLALAATAGLLGVGSIYAERRQYEPGVSPYPSSVPIRAVAVAESLALSGPVLNTSWYGGYIHWVRGERHPPLVDTRNLGSAGFRSRFVSAWTDSASLDSLIQDWRFTHAILQPPLHPEDRMAIDLSRRPEWALVFADDAGLLFVDRDRYPVAAARLGYHYWSPDYQRMGELAMKAMADRALERGFEAELERARAESPWHSRATLWLGLLRLAAGDAHGAATLLDEVERLAPVTPGLALRQGMARERIGDEAGARAAYRRALSEPADSAAARAALARLEVGR